MYKLELYIPLTHTEEVLKNIFNAGAGKIGHYDQCCFITEGTGQFRPLEGSIPTIGKQNVLQQVKEHKVELVIADEFVQNVKSSIETHHPYETPAYQFIKLSDNF